MRKRAAAAKGRKAPDKAARGKKGKDRNKASHDHG